VAEGVTQQRSVSLADTDVNTQASAKSGASLAEACRFDQDESVHEGQITGKCTSCNPIMRQMSGKVKRTRGQGPGRTHIPLTTASLQGQAGKAKKPRRLSKLFRERGRDISSAGARVHSHCLAGCAKPVEARNVPQTEAREIRSWAQRARRKGEGAAAIASIATSELWYAQGGQERRAANAAMAVVRLREC